ncbi:MAG: hypothetical protein ACK6AH_00200, partial [Gemmatimonadota bacterium]
RCCTTSVASAIPAAWTKATRASPDAAEDLAQLTIPGFLHFGGRGGSIRVDLSEQKLRVLEAGGHRFEHRVFPEQGRSGGTRRTR